MKQRQHTITKALALTSACALLTPNTGIPAATVHPTTILVGAQGTTVLDDVQAIMPTKGPFAFALLADNPATPQHRIGLTLQCPGPDTGGVPELTLHHSFFPAHEVQSWIQAPGTEPQRLGQPVHGSPTSGFHIFTVTLASEIHRITNILLQRGARAGDGNVAWENTQTEEENRTLLDLVTACTARR